MLNQHSGILSTTENDFLLYYLKDFFNADLSDKNIKEKLISGLLKRKNKVTTIWRLDRNMIESGETFSDYFHSYTDFCKWCYLVYGKKYFGKYQPLMIVDKNPVYTLHIKTLITHFPDSKFIALVRDYRDVISSQKRFFGLFKLMPMYGYSWKLNNELIYECSKKYQDKIMVVKYEDLVKTPGMAIKAICGFLNTEYEPGMLEYHKNLAPFIEQISKIFSAAQKKGMQEMFGLIGQPVTEERIGAGMRVLSKSQIRIADFIAGRTGCKFGYLPKYNFNFFEKILLHILTFPVTVISAIQINFFNYHYYYLPVRVRKIAEFLNIPLIIKRILSSYKNRA